MTCFSANADYIKFKYASIRRPTSLLRVFSPVFQPREPDMKAIEKHKAQPGIEHAEFIMCTALRGERLPCFKQAFISFVQNQDVPKGCFLLDRGWSIA